MPQPPVFIEDGQISPRQKRDSLEKPDGHPASEDHLGGDICSPEEQPSTDDEVPLD